MPDHKNKDDITDTINVTTDDGKKSCCITRCTKNHNFFDILLKLNGIILLFLSVLIISEIWLDNFDDNDFFSKILVSYAIIFVNFWVLTVMAKRTNDIGTDRNDGRNNGRNDGRNHTSDK